MQIESWLKAWIPHPVREHPGLLILVGAFILAVFIFKLLVVYLGYKLLKKISGKRLWLDDFDPQSIEIRNIAFHHLPWCVFTTDLRGKILTCNQAVQSFLGYLPTDLLGKNIAHLLHDPQEIKAYAEILSQQNHHKISANFHALVTNVHMGNSEEKKWTYICQDGRRLPVILTLSIMSSPKTGAIIGYIAVARPDDAPMHQKIEDTEKRWQFALESTSQGVWDWNLETSKVYYSKRWKQLLGYQEDELSDSYLEWEQRIHPEDLLYFKQQLIDYVDGKVPSLRVEHRMRCKDGSEKWIYVQGQAVACNESGHPIQLIGTFTDISQQKQVEQQLQRLSMISSLTSNAVILTDVEGNTEWVNEAFTTLSGYLPQEILGKKPGLLLQGPQTDPKTRMYIQHCLLHDKQCHADVLNYRKDGTPYWVELEIKPMLDNQGNLINFMAIETDITERKKAEELKHTFILMVSHELKTPLSSISGALHLVMQDASLSEKQGQLLRIADSNCQRLLRLIQDILHIEQMESGSFPFHMAPVDLNALVAKAVEDNQPFASQFGVTFEVALPSSSLQVQADQERLMQVLTNLLSNATKYSPKEGRVTIRVLPFSHSVRVEVEDQGPGVPKHAHHAVFEKFFQLPTPDQKQQKGTGLGLYLAHMIIQRHLGTMGIKSDQSKGACFYFELPLPET